MDVIYFKSSKYRVIKKENNIKIISRAGEPEPEPEPVGAGCFWLLGAGAA